MNLPLVAPKHIKEFSPEEYHAYVTGLQVRKVSKGSPVPGLSVSRTKKGKISIRYAKKARPLQYVTNKEIEILGKKASILQSELYLAFKNKKFLITADKAEAERINDDIAQIPW